MFDVKENKAICILPWVHEFKKISGDSAPCCHADSFKNNQTIHYVRESMLKGIKPDVCNKCYEYEEEEPIEPQEEKQGLMTRNNTDGLMARE